MAAATYCGARKPKPLFPADGWSGGEAGVSSTNYPRHYAVSGPTVITRVDATAPIHPAQTSSSWVARGAPFAWARGPADPSKEASRDLLLKILSSTPRRFRFPALCHNPRSPRHRRRSRAYADGRRPRSSRQRNPQERSILEHSDRRRLLGTGGQGPHATVDGRRTLPVGSRAPGAIAIAVAVGVPVAVA